MPELTYTTITTEGDYLKSSGVDLNTELTARLTDDVGDSNPAPRFIYGVECWLKEKILENNPIEVDASIVNDDYTFETEHQTNMFKRAVIYQIDYLLKSGNVTNESGFINGVILPRAELDKLGLDINARRCLRLGGLFNLRRC